MPAFRAHYAPRASPGTPHRSRTKVLRCKIAKVCRDFPIFRAPARSLATLGQCVDGRAKLVRMGDPEMADPAEGKDLQEALETQPDLTIRWFLDEIPGKAED